MTTETTGGGENHRYDRVNLTRLTPSVARNLRARAAEAGQSPSELVTELLTQQTRPTVPTQRRAPR
jgi:hypothetical protein